MFRTSKILSSSTQCQLSYLISVRYYGQRQESRPWKQRPNRKPRMKLILTEPVHNLGSRGDVVQVKGGYGRNYLVPKGKAVYAHHENCKLFGIADLKAAIKKSETKDKVGGVDLILRQFTGKTLVMQQDPAVYNWSLREQHIATGIATQFKVHVPLDYIEMEKPLTQFGQSSVIVKLVEGKEGVEPVQVTIPVDVIHKVEKKRKLRKQENENDIIL